VAEPTLPPYGVGDLPGAGKREAPAAARNMVPIAEVLADWLPAAGLVLEIASGTGEHALAYARRFRGLRWQPTDPDPEALASIAAWRAEGPPNLLAPLRLDAAAPDWPVRQADAILCINMVHISPWEASLGLLAGAKRVLAAGGRMILYGPWLERGVEPEPSNLTFDEWLKDRDPRFGLREVETFAEIASAHGLLLVERRAMPANNLMLLFERQDA
jgi:SAM-dependent methyltransferase